MPLILVDTSYTSFIVFATLRWFSMHDAESYKTYKNDSNYDWSTNKIFMEKYEKMYLKSIIDIIGKKYLILLLLFFVWILQKKIFGVMN